MSKKYKLKRREGGFMAKILKFKDIQAKKNQLLESNRQLTKKQKSECKKRLIYDDDTYLESLYEEELKEM